MTAETLRILIVDDHAVVRAGLRALLEGEPGLDVIAETGDGREAVHLARRLRPDVVLMDLRLSDAAASDDGFGGIEATRRITAAVPGVSVVVLTSYGGRNDVVRAVEAGARGYILKAGPPEELFRAARAAAVGGMGLAPEAVARLVGRTADPGPVLSERETEVVRLLAQGLTWSGSTASSAPRTGPARSPRPSASASSKSTSADRSGDTEPGPGYREASCDERYRARRSAASRDRVRAGPAPRPARRCRSRGSRGNGHG